MHISNGALGDMIWKISMQIIRSEIQCVIGQATNARLVKPAHTPRARNSTAMRYTMQRHAKFHWVEIKSHVYIICMKSNILNLLRRFKLWATGLIGVNAWALNIATTDWNLSRQIKCDRPAQTHKKLAKISFTFLLDFERPKSKL